MRALAFWPLIRSTFEYQWRKIDVCGSPGSQYNQRVLYKPVCFVHACYCFVHACYCFVHACYCFVHACLVVSSVDTSSDMTSQAKRFQTMQAFLNSLIISWFDWHFSSAWPVILSTVLVKQDFRVYKDIVVDLIPTILLTGGIPGLNDKWSCHYHKLGTQQSSQHCFVNAVKYSQNVLLHPQSSAVPASLSWRCYVHVLLYSP